MVHYRSFRNTDPPALVEIWNEAFIGRGAGRLRHSSVLERHVFAKPYFDAAGLIVAEENGTLAGFAHAGFGPNQRETILSKAAGVVSIVAVRPAFQRKGIGTELLTRAEAYLKERGATPASCRSVAAVQLLLLRHLRRQRLARSTGQR